MSKKQVQRRLDHLFSELVGHDAPPVQPGQIHSEDEQQPVCSSTGHNGDEALPHIAVSAGLSGWSWEIDANGCFTSCGPEVSDALRLNPHSFHGKPILDHGLDASARGIVEKALRCETLPVKCDVLYLDAQGNIVPARLHILSRVPGSHGADGWRGYTQPVALSTASPDRKTTPTPTHQAPEARAAFAAPLTELSGNLQGYALDHETLHPARTIWTTAGKRSLEQNELVSAPSGSSEPAALAFPLQMKGVGDLLLEVVDDDQEREWTEDDRVLVMEVASQLALALDNAQLYRNVQQELAERIRAEQAILRRNRDLAALNRIGRELGRLTSREEIFELLGAMISDVLHSHHVFFAWQAPGETLLSFPVAIEDGQAITLPGREPAHGIPEYVMRTRLPLLVEQNAPQALQQLGITLPERIPASLLAIPLNTGERVSGVVVVQDFEHEGAFDSLHAELLSTAASQAATALENADLFEQMQKALRAIENRERYQASVARSAAALTEYGTRALPDVLEALGHAAQCSRVYFTRVYEDAQGPYWAAAADWIDPSVAYLFDKTRILRLPATQFPQWTQSLRENGWVITHSASHTSGASERGTVTQETDFLAGQHIRTTLLLAIPGPASVPGFLAFDQLGSPRAWLNEEVSALRVAADAIANTLVREDLLEQLQVTLDETEALYKASNNLAVASDMQEMVAAVISGVRSPDINRAVLVLFELDAFGKMAQAFVGANWYSGRGAPPPPVGTEYIRARYDRFFQRNSPLFLDDILDGQIEKDLLDTLLNQKIRGLALLPLWSSKRQTGVLMVQSEKVHPFTGREKRTYPPLADQMAIAVENQRLFEQTQVALSETELLYNVSSRIAQAASAQEMLALVTETVLPHGADRAGLFLLHSNTNNELSGLEIAGFQDRSGEKFHAGKIIDVSDIPLVRSLTGEALVIRDITEPGLVDPVSQKTLDSLQIRAGCLAPLRSGGRLIGLLVAAARGVTEFSQEDTRLIRIVGNGVAVALEKQRLLRQAQRRALELQTASEIARDTASTLSLDLLLKRIVSMLLERFTFHQASIFLLDESGAYGVIRESTGAAEISDPDQARRRRIPVGSNSIVGKVLASGESCIVNDAQADGVQIGTMSEMGIPLKLGATVIGALDLHSLERNAFNEDDVTVLQILADQIAIAIENARAYELSQKAIADMQEVDRVKSQFLANMSHELRTPLNSIIGFSRVILKGIDGPINDTQKQDLNAIYNSGQHLLALITDILDLSKIEAGKMELAFSEVNLSDLINSAMSTAVGLVKDKPIRLHTQVAEDLPAVRADSTRIRQVLINFLSNAAKFTDEGNITVEARRHVSPERNAEVLITVSDTGPGIAQEDQVKLFLPFSQVDDSPTRKTGGTGLGLSICRSLIEMHGGRIGLLHSDVGKGSTFYFTLPLAAPEPLPISPPDESATGDVVLVIDDDPKVISLYRRYLLQHNYEIVAVTDPTQAVARARETRPCAITLDIMMPGKDGWQVLNDLKQDPSTKSIPIIICSLLDETAKAYSQGAASYLVKPFLQEDMLNALGKRNQSGAIRNVLVIDDDPADLRLVEKMLGDETNLRVTLAEGGSRGWNHIQQQPPDAVIMDLFMPDLNGFTLLERMRADNTLRDIPVILLTGADLSPELHQQLTNLGQGVLPKGYLHEKELLSFLEEALRKIRPNGKNGHSS